MKQKTTTKSELSEEAIRASDVSRKEKEALTFILRVSEIEQAVFFRENPSCIYRSGAGFRVSPTWLNALESYTVDDMKAVIKVLSTRAEGEPFTRTLSLKLLNSMLHKEHMRRVAPSYTPIKAFGVVDEDLNELKNAGLYYEMEETMRKEKSAAKKMRIFMSYKKKLDPSTAEIEQKAINIAKNTDNQRGIKAAV